jgi:hypothetical protein
VTPPALRRLVDQLARMQGPVYAEAIKRRLLTDLDALRASGADYAALLAHVEAFDPVAVSLERKAAP